MQLYLATKKENKKINGFSLIELMLALVISLMIFNMLLLFYLKVLERYQYNWAILKLEAKLQQAAFLIEHAIERPLSQSTVLTDPKDQLISVSRVRICHPDSRYQACHQEKPEGLKKQTDWLTIETSSYFSVVSNKSDKLKGLLVIQAKAKLHAGDRLVFADQNQTNALIKAAINLPDQQGAFLQKLTLMKPLKYPNSLPGIAITKRQLFVANTERMDGMGKPIYSLYLKEGKEKRREFVGSIDDLKMTDDLDLTLIFTEQSFRLHALAQRDIKGELLKTKSLWPRLKWQTSLKKFEKLI